MKVLLILLCFVASVSADDHDPMYWQVDSIAVDTAFVGHFGAFYPEDIDTSYLSYARIPDRWTMRVGTVVKQGGYGILLYGNGTLVPIPKRIDTTWIKKQPVFLTAEEREKLRRLIHGGIYTD